MCEIFLLVRAARIIKPEQKLCGYEKANKKFESSEKFLIGCQAVGRKPVEEISDEVGMSREYVYQQKEKVSQYAKGLDNTKQEAPQLKLDEQTIDRMILSLTLDCQWPNSGIVRFFETGSCIKLV